MTKLKVFLGTMGGAIAAFAGTMLAHAQSVPTLGSSDIAEADNPVWQAVIDGGKFILKSYGPLVVYILLIVGVFYLAYRMLRHFRA